MGRPLLLLTLAAAAWLPAMMPTAAGAEERVPVAVLDFHYVDTSGEARNQAEEHRLRLQEFMSAVRADLARSERYRVVTITCEPAPCSLETSQPEELIAAARRAGAKLLLFGGIQKVSTLVQWGKAQVIDIETERVLFDRLISFRGDDVTAWRRAEAFLMKEILATLAG